MKKIIILVVLVLVAGGYWWMNKQESVTTGDSTSKLDMQVVCESALAYMSFPDGEAAAQFVMDCKDGKYPEVIERYKVDMGLGSDVAI